AMKKQLLNSGLSKIIFSLLLVITSSFALAGFKQTQTWSTNPFDEKEIIENKGQFTSKYNQLNEPILYTINQGGVNIYFSATGITWRHDDVTMKEEEGMFKKKKAEEEEFNIKTNLLHMHWENSDPN